MARRSNRGRVPTGVALLVVLLGCSRSERTIDLKPTVQ
jgi:hypothetical protein